MAYLSAPLDLMSTPAYDAALVAVRLRRRKTGDVIYSARDCWRGSAHWRHDFETVLAHATSLYVLTDAQGRIGPGSLIEYRYVRDRRPDAVIRMFIAAADGSGCDGGRDGAGFIVGRAASITNNPYGEAVPRRVATLIRARPVLSLVPVSVTGGDTVASRSTDKTEPAGTQTPPALSVEASGNAQSIYDTTRDPSSGIVA